MRALTQSHERTSKRMTIDRASDFNQTTSAKKLDGTPPDHIHTTFLGTEGAVNLAFNSLPFFSVLFIATSHTSIAPQAEYEAYENCLQKPVAGMDGSDLPRSTFPHNRAQPHHGRKTKPHQDRQTDCAFPSAAPQKDNQARQHISDDDGPNKLPNNFPDRRGRANNCGWIHSPPYVAQQ